MNTKKSLKLSHKLALGMILFSTVGLLVAFAIVNTVVRSSVYDNVIAISQRDKIIYAERIDAWLAIGTHMMDNLSNIVLNVGIWLSA